MDDSLLLPLAKSRPNFGTGNRKRGQREAPEKAGATPSQAREIGDPGQRSTTEIAAARLVVSGDSSISLVDCRPSHTNAPDRHCSRRRRSARELAGLQNDSGSMRDCQQNAPAETETRTESRSLSEVPLPLRRTAVAEMQLPGRAVPFSVLSVGVRFSRSLALPRDDRRHERGK